MKKITKIILASLTVLMLVSCGKKLPAPDAFGFYNDMDAAVTAAKKSHKNILLYITLAGFDDYSEEFTNSVLHADEYKELFDKEFVSVHFDFGSDAYEKSTVNEAMSSEEQKKVEEFNNQIMKNMTLARSMGVTGSPAVYFMNEDGYAFGDEVAPETMDGENQSFASAQNLYALVAEYKEDFDLMKELVDATKKGSAMERMQAINNLYETLDSKYIPSLTSLFKETPSIDKKNETGLLSYLYCVYVMNEATNFAMVNDFGSAINLVRDELAKNILSGEEEQYAYFVLANLLMQVGSNDYTGITGYLNKAVEAEPDSELAGEIRLIIEQIEDIISTQGSLDMTEQMPEMETSPEEF